MRRFKTAKTELEVSLHGTETRLDVLNGSIRSVEFTDATGKVVRFHSDYGLSVSVLDDTKKKKQVHALRYKLLGKDEEEVFETWTEAHDREKVVNESIRDANPQIVEVEVETDEI